MTIGELSNFISNKYGIHGQVKLHYLKDHTEGIEEEKTIKDIIKNLQQKDEKNKKNNILYVGRIKSSKSFKSSTKLELVQPTEDDNDNHNENNENKNDHLNKYSNDFTKKTNLIIEIVHAMSYIHKKGLIHRDLMIDNITFDSKYNSKIVDFGIVKIYEQVISDYSFTNDSLTGGIGTLTYMSPEIENEDEYDYKTDVYSFRRYYFLPKQKKKDKMNGKPIIIPKAPEHVTSFCLDLISGCLLYDSKNRPSFDEIINELRTHSYHLFKTIKEEDIKERDSYLSGFQ